MNARTNPAIVMLLLVAIAPAPAGGEEGGGRIDLSPDVHVEPVTEGVWRHVSHQEQEGYGRVPANGLVVVGSDAVALLDTPWTDEQTGLVLDWVERRFGVPVGHVVPTHSHADCMGGLGMAHRRGARSYAHEKTVELARRDGLPVPQTAFAARHDVVDGDLVLELRHLGAGHTQDNVVVWIPGRRVLFGGCLVKPRGAGKGYLGDADLRAWPATIRAVRAAFPDAAIVVPGHGAPGTLDHLDYTEELVRKLAAEKP
jgi:metallo-beta-lactamase class B